MIPLDQVKAYLPEAEIHIYEAGRAFAKDAARLMTSPCFVAGFDQPPSKPDRLSQLM